MSKPSVDFLVVDDDQTFASVLVRALNRKSFSCVMAHNSVQALELIDKNAISKAIIDLKLVDESGLHLIRELKLREPKLDIVMLTGYSSIATAVEAIKYGATNYLCKPTDINNILSAFTLKQTPAEDVRSYLPPSIDRLEWEHIQRHLQENDGNISATARALGMHRRTLQRKLQKYPVRN